MCNCNGIPCRCNQWNGYKFWVVLSADGKHPGKFVTHENKELAEKEAQRLAAQERKPFLVLETVGGFQPPLQVEPIKFKEVTP